MSEMFDVVTVGAFNIDQLRQVADFKPDGEVSSQGTSYAGGGSHANTAVAVGRLGRRVAVLGAIGYDGREKGVLDDLEAANVCTDWVTTKPDKPTGEALTINSPAGRSMIITPGANLDYDIADASAAVRAGAMRTRLMHVTSFDKQGVAGNQLAAQEFLIEQLESETLVSFAPGELYAALGVGQLAVLLSRTDYLIGNPGEIGALGNEPEWNYEAAANTLLAKFPHIRAVAITMGSGRHRDDFYRPPGRDPKQPTITDLLEDSGAPVDPILSSVICTPSGRIDVEQTPFTGDIVDTTGAGDAWTAGFLHGVLDGCSLHTCAVMGDLVAQHSLIGLGARTGLPTLDQLDSSLVATR